MKTYPNECEQCGRPTINAKGCADHQNKKTQRKFMNLNELAKEVHKTAVAKGWWDEKMIYSDKCPYIIPKSIGDQFANFHSEISEAWEEYRKGKGMNEVYHVDGKPEGVPIELADLLIRVLDTCAAYNIDLEAAIAEKMEYNLGRSYRHGGKLA